jgi:glycine cleavage system H protein
MVEQLIGWLTPVLIFLVGLTVRALLLVGVMIVVGIPIVAALFGWQGVTWLADRALGLRKVGHLRFLETAYYTPAHLWLQERGEAIRLGLDDVAQKVLPEIRAVALREAGTEVTKGEPIGEISCPEGVITIKAPVNGIIAVVNDRVIRQPVLLHRDPYRAWLMEVRPKADGYTQWPSADRAREWLAEEDRRLTDFFEHQLGIATADGGELLMPAHKALTPQQWDTIRKSFLGAA